MKISTDEMNDIIRAWVNDEFPRPAGGFETNALEDDWRDATARRFDRIIAMEDFQFCELYRTKTGSELRPMNSDGSYTPRELGGAK